jgi:hypothetical protein
MTLIYSVTLVANTQGILDENQTPKTKYMICIFGT